MQTHIHTTHIQHAHALYTHHTHRHAHAPYTRVHAHTHTVHTVDTKLLLGRYHLWMHLSQHYHIHFTFL